MSSYDALKPLADEQRRAADPEELVWLSASAGTGKTQVLSARVLRLLLRSDDFKPETILCLTFTKAGATEMADRINSRLAHWVMASDTDIAIDLKSLGERFDPEMVKRARTLFARVLDARGGGLRIQTIHSFCQSLLGSFPAEIGLPPGFTLIEPREEAALPMRLLADMAVAAEREGRLGFGEQLRALGHRLDEDRIQKLLIRCAKVPDVMAALPGGDGLLPYLRRMLCGVDDVAGWLAARVETVGFVSDELDQLIAYNASWGTKTGLDRNALIANWRGKSGDDRVAGLKTLQEAWITKSGTLHKVVPKPVADHYTALCETLHRWCGPLVEIQLRAQQAEDFALMLSVGREFADHYVQAKQMRGLVDYDDLIRKTVELLEMPGMGDWIRYKLDQATDHILIDEAQDTNDRQWAIIKAIAGEFFVGSGARGTVHRTLFTVGDYKQAIFGFQGTDPRHFSAAQGYFGKAAEAVERELLDLSLSRSFRSSPPILDLVDAVISGIGGDALGLSALPPRHVSASGGGGAVTLMPPVVDLGSDDGDEDEESWVPQSARKLASDIAEQVKGWLDAGLWLEKEGRAIEPQDVLILVRSRGELASLIVAQLNKARVSVAGVDRLQLGLPLAVKDLLACIRFALQPLDDLNLAALLVSPLFGWSQEELFETAHARGDKHLWPHLRQTLPDERLHSLYFLLSNADFSTPYAFLEMILSGEMDGRRKLIARLGDEARDPIDELLNAALDYTRNHPPSLQLFLDWFDRGDVEIKRDAFAASNAVRVMTVHGAKGLQAPIVILADATAKPKKAKGGDLFDWVSEDGLKLPLLRPSVAELTGSLRTSAEESDAAEAREHWRLLYVALTRAEERLVITGALGPQARGIVPDGSWYQAIDTALMTMGVEGIDGRKDYVVKGKSAAKAITKSVKPASLECPAWLAQAAPVEARPPRPLAPSSLGRDDVADPPPPEVMKVAADRGRWLHALFERLPGVAADRAAVADRWLAQSAGVGDAAMRAALINSALTVIDDPAYAALFGADALAEAPIVGVVGGDVIAGTVDRLVVTEDSVIVVDFKTGRRVPSTPATCPVPHVRQMAAYHALLATIFPGKAVSAGLLYTAGPIMHILPEALLAAHKPGLSAG